MQLEPELGKIGIWAGDLDQYPAERLREAATLIERLGYGTLWFPETTGREAMAQAAILLAATGRITVAAGAADLYARDAVTAAAAQRTLGEAFPGRFLLGIWESHPSLAADIRGHRHGDPVPTVRSYLDAMDAAPFGPPGVATRALPRLVSALHPDMLTLARERAAGATVLGLPVEYTRQARGILGPGPLLAVTQLCVLAPDRSAGLHTARGTAAAALPNRRALLGELGHRNVDALDDRLVDALVAHGPAAHIGDRVREHLAAGADHVCLHMVTDTPGVPPAHAWALLAAELLG